MSVVDLQHERRLVEAATDKLRDGRIGTAAGAYGELLSQYESLVKRLDREEAPNDRRSPEAMMQKLIEIGIALSADRNPARLMESILREAKELTNADGGTLYTRTEDDELRFEIIRNDTLNIAKGGTTGEEIEFDPLPMYDAEGTANHSNVATHVALSGRTINVPDAYDTEEFDFTGAKRFDEGMSYRSKSFLTVPLKTRQGDVIGVLQLINARDPATGDVVGFPAEFESYVGALASQAAVALDNQQLLEAQKVLLDSFIMLIAGAIDEKSPYTGGHCNRVPDLAMMLAQAACEVEDGPFAGFSFDDEQWYEFQVAGWLHDCGKVTTPEYVVDKATKLETIYNRVHEVRTRFEVLRRDAEIAYLEGRLAGGDEATLRAARDDRIAQLDDDFAFIAECNIGGEFMSDERIERLNQIAGTTWTRHFDDRIGVSHDELRRMERTPATPLPAAERLLSDNADFGSSGRRFQ